MKKSIILSVLLIFLTATATAMTISEPKGTYNLGDRIFITVNDIIGTSTGNFKINLICDNKSIPLLTISARAFSTTGDQSYELPYKELTKEDLEIENLQEILGQCYIESSIGEEYATSEKFTISEEILIIATTNKQGYDPEEEMTISIEATKANGNLLNGHIEASGIVSFSQEISEGRLEKISSLPEMVESGIYNLTIDVYDEWGNKGQRVIPVKINQIPKSIEVSLSDIEAIPGEEFTIGGKIFDQSKKEMAGTITLTIISPMGEEIQRTISSGSSINLLFETNTTAGNWMILSSFSNVEEQTEFRVAELQKVSFNLEGSILTIKNVGNIIYNKTVEIDIGGEKQKLELNLLVGEEKLFNMEAPDGEYEVTITDNESSFQGLIPLTGNAINLKDITSSGNYLFVWILILLVLIAIGVVIYFRYLKKQTGLSVSPFKSLQSKIQSKIPTRMANEMSHTMHLTNKSPESQSLDEKTLNKQDESLRDLTIPRVIKAEPSLVLRGEKTLTTIVAIGIKNYDQLTPNSIESLKEILSIARNRKGLVDFRDEEVFLVFSPLVTKTYNNEQLGIATASEIRNKLEDHNRKFSNKIRFNIGINSGELVASKEQGKLKYTSLGSTISLAKRLANSEEGKIIVTESIRNRLMRDLKVEKINTIGKTNVYEVKKVMDREEDKTKLKELLKRMK